MKSFEEILKNSRLWGYEATPFGYSAWIKLPDCGTCSALWSDREDGWEHVSVSPKKKFNIPTWNDMCIVKDVFWNSEEEAYQIHPKKNEYVNSMNNCLHIWKPIGHEISELTTNQELLSAMKTVSRYCAEHPHCVRCAIISHCGATPPQNWNFSELEVLRNG